NIHNTATNHQPQRNTEQNIISTLLPDTPQRNTTTRTQHQRLFQPHHNARQRKTEQKETRYQQDRKKPTISTRQKKTRYQHPSQPPASYITKQGQHPVSPIKTIRGQLQERSSK
ncbi:hypothetical protein Pmani_039034, partial [Petrolisthes manimaculis]